MLKAEKARPNHSHQWKKKKRVENSMTEKPRARVVLFNQPQLIQCESIRAMTRYISNQTKKHNI
jgi:hypothetical protein